MKIASALIGLATLGVVALSGTAASAAPIDAPVSAMGIVVPAGYVCNEWNHCWHRHNYGGYYHHAYWGGYGWHHHWAGDGGYGWHHWRRWHHWHHWHRW